METLQIKKFISQGGVTLEIGDFYGGGLDEAITSMEETNNKLTINTALGFYDLTLKAGDYLLQVDGSSKLVKSKFDKDEF